MRRPATTQMFPRGARVALASLATVVVALVVGGGCTQDFPPFNHLDSLRVLAIQSEPAAPLPGETSIITPLVFTPADAPALSFEWSWCPAAGPAEGGYECLIHEEELAAALGGVPFPSFDLHTDPTAMLQNGLPPELLGAICGGTIPNLPQPNCANGFPIQVTLKVGNGKETVKSVVTTHWRFNDMQAPNANPVVGGLTAMLDGTPTAITDMLADDTVTLPRNRGTRLDVMVGPEASETYDGIDEEDMPATGLRERLFMTWFIESGDTDDLRTSFIPGRTPFEDMLKNIWTPDETRLYSLPEARVYVVLHDSRGGVGWRSGIVKLEPTP